MKMQNENWEVRVGNEIFQADTNELASWINEGSVSKTDLVKRGNLRWLEAGKIPALHDFFNAKELGIIPQIGTSTNSQTEHQNNQTISNFPEYSNPHEQFQNLNHFGQQINQFPEYCVIHPEKRSEYYCETCLNQFCLDCPTSYGTKAKVCPMCGAMCNEIHPPED